LWKDFLMGAVRERNYWPTGDWVASSPHAQGMDADALSRLQAYGQDSTPNIHGIAVIRHGYLVWEQYHHGFHRDSLHSVNSVTKSVVSALVGIALHEGLIDNLDRHLVDLLPDDAILLDDLAKQAITLRHLLCMTSGFPRLPIEEFPHRAHLLRDALTRPLVNAPGEAFLYDDASAHLVSAILARSTGMSTAAFAERTLFGPLGIRTVGAARAVQDGSRGPHTSHPFGLWGNDVQSGCAWMVDRQGLHLGGFGLHLTLRDMAKFGYLYLNEGRWNMTTIVPSEYVHTSTQSHGLAGSQSYGYLWWVPHHDLDPSAFFAAGYGGQYIDVLPTLDVVIAIACSLDQGPLERHGQTVSRLVAAAIR
jgi:CubicO group peptidase (beta-lactamase class C family)